ncbi:MAG TPA: flavodoxin domain-containing protein [Candidatus Methylomirabilis sp.]
MAPEVRLAEGIFWVGAVDWNARNFHGYTYTTHRGTTYNAYLILDEKNTLIDTVYGPFAGEMLGRIRQVIDPSRIDYLIANHVETDHSGSIPQVLQLAPQAKVFCTQKGKEGLQKHYFGDWDFQVVKTGDELKLGRRTLQFLEAPMLHWPDSMFTYVKEEALLLPNDAFGQHLATTERFTDEVDEGIVMEEATKYFANILTPFSPLIIKKIEEVGKLGIPIKTIGPSHGLIWRKDPEKIIQAYLRWSRGEAANRVVIAYDTMWGSTEKMANAMLEGIKAAGVEGRLYKLSVSDRSDVIAQVLEAKGLLVGSSTINRDLLPTVAPFIEDLKGLKPQAKIGAAFGSFGWSGEAAKTLEEKLKQAGVQIVQPALTLKWVPSSEELQACFEFGRKFGEAVKGSV